MLNKQIIVYCVVALLLGMLLANMLKSVCGCTLVEGAFMGPTDASSAALQVALHNQEPVTNTSLRDAMKAVCPGANISLPSLLNCMQQYANENP